MRLTGVSQNIEALRPGFVGDDGPGGLFRTGAIVWVARGVTRRRGGRSFARRIDRLELGVDDGAAIGDERVGCRRTALNNGLYERLTLAAADDKRKVDAQHNECDQRYCKNDKDSILHLFRWRAPPDAPSFHYSIWGETRLITEAIHRKPDAD